MSLGEELAALEHDQWVHWAKSILETENISPERRARWEPFFVPYDQLSEEVKEYDRKWVYMIEGILNDYDIDTEAMWWEE